MRHSLSFNVMIKCFCLQVEDGEPPVLWLSGLHIPESYLTALVQAACRKNGWPLDRSTLYTSVTKYRTPDEVTEHAHTGCFIRGLYLEGASWDLNSSCLDRPKPKQLVEQLPILKVIPIEAHKLKLQVSVCSSLIRNIIYFEIPRRLLSVGFNVSVSKEQL